MRTLRIEKNGEKYEGIAGLFALLEMLDLFFRQGHTEFRLAIQNNGHAIIHAHGKDSDTFDIYWE